VWRRRPLQAPFLYRKPHSLDALFGLFVHCGCFAGRTAPTRKSGYNKRARRRFPGNFHDITHCRHARRLYPAAVHANMPGDNRLARERARLV
jgi:hypothetical protein